MSITKPVNVLVFAGIDQVSNSRNALIIIAYSDLRHKVAVGGLAERNSYLIFSDTSSAQEIFVRAYSRIVDS